MKPSYATRHTPSDCRTTPPTSTTAWFAQPWPSPPTDRASTTVQKPLLGAALHGLVPDWLLRRRTKGAYDGNAYRGLRRHSDVLHDLLSNSELAAEGWIDAHAARTELDRLTAGVPGKLAALESLVTAELWLHQHRTGTPVTTTHEVSHA